MKTRTMALVVLATAGVLAVGLVGVILLGRLLQGVREELSTETARQQFVAQWRPPLELSEHAVFPPRIDGHAVGVAEVNPVLTAPALELAGVRTTYTRPGAPAVEVFVARANDLEAQAVFQRMREAFRGRSGSRLVVEVPGRLRLSAGAAGELETVEVWSLQGWLLIFRAKGELDAGFIRAYLVAVAGRSGRNL